MPLVFIFIGILLVVAAINNKLPDLKALAAEDFSPSDGSVGFHIWILALFIAGAIGYVKELKPVSTAFLTLIIVSLILANGNPKNKGGGFFVKFQEALKER